MKIFKILHTVKCKLVQVESQYGTSVGYVRLDNCNGKVLWFMELSEGEDSPMELLQIVESKDLELLYQENIGNTMSENK